MTGRTRREAIPIDDVYAFPNGRARSAKPRVEAIKRVSTGSDLRKVAEAIAPNGQGHVSVNGRENRTKKKFDIYGNIFEMPSNP